MSPIEQEGMPVAPKGEERRKHRSGSRRQQKAAIRASWLFEPSVKPRQQAKVGRNEPCPCGMLVDGKPVKFKDCCGG